MDDLSDKPIISTVAAPATKLMPFAEFLGSCGPDSTHHVAGLVRTAGGSGSSVLLQSPEIELHCDSEICNGVRRFHNDENLGIYGSLDFKFVTYVCKNCGKTRKTFALAVSPDPNRISGRVQKLGELPPFGPPIPSRVMKLVGEDREFFLKGRRAELRGLGIGAFAYYRRVVEEQKGRIIEEVGKVAAKIKPSKETADLFAKAKAETQFTNAIDMIKSAIPEALLIDGHNPLKLLHSALSEGLHAQTDEQCLELATSIRVVLSELAEGISTALKEEATLKSAVNRLLNRTSD
jgi:hypothetical protein